MRAKRLVAAAVAGATTLAVIGGCAARELQALEPKLELRNAAQQLTDAPRAGFTLRLSGNVDDLIAAVKPAGDVPIAEDAATVRRLFDSSVTIAYDKAGAAAKDDRWAVAATVGGATGTEFRYVDGTLYAKVPVADLATAFGAAAAEVTSLRDALPALDALFDGRWVSVDGAGMADLANFGTGRPTRDLSSEKAVTELTTGAADLLDGASVVRDGKDGRHLIVTSSTTAAYAAAKRFATAIDKDLASDFTAPPKDRPIVLDLWLDAGKLTAAEINILQFIDGAAGRVAARLEVTTGAAITAPDGASKLDLSALLGTGAPGPGLLGPDDIAVPGTD